MSLIDLKEEIKELAAYKAQLTQQRVQYKVENRPKLREELAAVRKDGVEDWAQPPEFYRILGRYEDGIRGIDYDRADAKFKVRCALLAYGFLRGRRYKQLERKVREGNEPDVEGIAHYIVQYGGVASRDDVVRWVEGKDPEPREMPHPVIEGVFSLDHYYQHIRTERDGTKVTLDRTTREVLSPIPATIGRVEVAS